MAHEIAVAAIKRAVSEYKTRLAPEVQERGKFYASPFDAKIPRASALPVPKFAKQVILYEGPFNEI